MLEVVRARIDVDGKPAVEGLSFATTGERVLVLGAARALFEAAAGMRPVAHGEVRLRGEGHGSSVRSGKAAVAPLDPRVPPKWTVHTYVFWSARLAGHGRLRARTLADHAIDQLKIGNASDAPLGALELVVRRATIVAGALATDARLILLEDPTSNLPDTQARSLARVIVQATAGRASILFAARMPLGSPLTMDADEAVVVTGGAVDAQGAPAELASSERTVALRVEGDSASFARVAAERGAKVAGVGGHLRVDLGETLKVRDLLAVAAETQATLIEVRPVSGAFA